MSGESLNRSPAWPEYAFVRELRGEGVAWSDVALSLGLSAVAAKGRFGRGDGDNAVSRRAWEHHGREARALIDLLLEEPNAKAVLTVYLVAIHRRLARFSPELARAAVDAGELRIDARQEAREADDHFGAPIADLESIAARVASRHGLAVGLIRGRERTREACLARDEFAYLAKEAGFRLQRIGAFAGGRDHSSMSNAVKRHKARRRAE